MKAFTVQQITTAERIAKLIAKHVRKELTEEEDEELGAWIGANPKRIKLFEEMTDPVRIKKALEILNS